MLHADEIEDDGSSGASAVVEDGATPTPAVVEGVVCACPLTPRSVRACNLTVPGLLAGWQPSPRQTRKRVGEMTPRLAYAAVAKDGLGSGMKHTGDVMVNGIEYVA